MFYVTVMTKASACGLCGQYRPHSSVPTQAEDEEEDGCLEHDARPNGIERCSTYDLASEPIIDVGAQGATIADALSPQLISCVHALQPCASTYESCGGEQIYTDVVAGAQGNSYAVDELHAEEDSDGDGEAC